MKDEIDYNKATDELIEKLKSKGNFITKEDMQSLDTEIKKYTPQQFYEHMTNDCSNDGCALHKLATDSAKNFWIRGFAQGRAFQTRFAK